MRRRCMIIAAALVLAMPAASAQQLSIGAKGGLTIPNITPGGKKTPLSEGYSSRLAWGAGAFAEIGITPTFSIQVGLEYSGQGGKKDGMQAVPITAEMAPMFGGYAQAITGVLAGSGMVTPAMAAEMADQVLAPMQSDYLYAKFESKAKFNYLMLPIQAKFGWNLSPTSPVRLYVSAGIFGSYLMNAERVSSGTSKFFADKNSTTMSESISGSQKFADIIPEPLKQTVAYAINSVEGAVPANSFNQTQDITNDIYRFNFGFIGSVGVSYEINPRNKIFIEGGGNYGLVKIQKNDEHGQNRIGSGSVMVGYSYTLGR